MLLSDLFLFSLETLTFEFFLSLLILNLLLFGSYLSQQKINYLYIKIVNNIILYFIIFLFIFLFNTPDFSITLLNGIFIFDNFSKLLKLILVVNMFLVILIQRKYLINYNLLKFETSIFMLIVLLGLAIINSSYHFIILYLGLELQSLSFYILASSNTKSIFSSEAAIKYFILGAIASGFILYGISIIYLISGTLNFGNLSCILLNVNKIYNLKIFLSLFYGLLFFLIGLLFKLGAYPFHNWLPDVYEGSPSNVTALFSIVPKTIIFGLIIRLFYTIFYDIFEFFEIIFYFCALFSILFGSFVSLYQKKIKRLLAYSSITHTGFILLGFLSNSFENIQSILFYLIFYIIMTVNLWSILLSVFQKKKTLFYLSQLLNFHRLNGYITFIFILTLFSMAGIPPLAGFFSKMFIFFSALKDCNYGIVIIGFLLSVVSTFYYIRIIKIMFFEKSYEVITIENFSKANSIVLAINTQILLFFFINPNYLLNFLNKIVFSFLI